MSEEFSNVASSATTNSTVTQLRLAGLRVTGVRLEYDVICADCRARDKERAHDRAAVLAAGR